MARLILLVSTSYGNFPHLHHASGMNVHTYQVIEEVDAALMSLVNMETGQRGFALTGKDIKKLAPGALRRIQKLPDLVKSFFRQPECQYAAN